MNLRLLPAFTGAAYIWFLEAATLVAFVVVTALGDRLGPRRIYVISPATKPARRIALGRSRSATGESGLAPLREAAQALSRVLAAQDLG